jgi:hypothetical protein
MNEILHGFALVAFRFNVRVLFLSEILYIYPCVVRQSDVMDSHEDQPMIDDESMHSESSFPFHEHSEVTSSQHLYSMAHMSQRQSQRQPQRKQSSLYDYGMRT